MIEAPPQAQSILESPRTSVISKTFSKFRWKKNSISSMNNDPYSRSGVRRGGKRFMSQPMLSFGPRDAAAEADTSSTSTDGRERRSVDALRAQPPSQSNRPLRPPPSTQPISGSLDAQERPNIQNTPRLKQGPSPSITTALIAGANVGVAVIDGLPRASDFVFPPNKSLLPIPSTSSNPSSSTAAITATATASLPRISTRPTPGLVRLPSSSSPYATARLSHTIITRAPMPILNLPPLPPLPAPTPSSSTSTSTRATRGLRSMPALPRQGTVDDTTNDGDGDDDEGDESGSEDEEDDSQFVDAPEGVSDDGASAAEGHSTPRRHSHLPPLVLENTEWASFISNALSSQTPTQRDQSQTPTDYFSTSSRLSQIHRSPMSRMRVPVTPATPGPVPRIPGRIPPTPTTSQVSPTPPSIVINHAPIASKPAMYKQPSKSMINILGPAMTRREDEEPQTGLKVLPTGAQKATPPRPGAPTAASAFVAPVSPTLRSSAATLTRRRSLPTFTAPGSPPPPYPSFAPHWRGSMVDPPHIDAAHRHQHQIIAEDDNAIEEVPRNPQPEVHPPHFGGETLPSYSNDIYLKTTMPRKMEFTAPGVQARDRKWRRAVCELEGTVLRIYEDVTTSGIGGWWERRVGVGDVANNNNSPTSATQALTRAAAAREVDHSIDPKAGEVGNQTELTIPAPSPNLSPPQPTRSILGRILTHGRSQSDVPPSPTAASPTTPPGRSSLNLPDTGRRRSSTSRSRFGSNLNIAGRSSPSVSPTISTHSSNMSISSSSSSASPKLNSCNGKENLRLLRSYTLQHAESGLGNDYLKRKNVIRVRMEGEQFLLQAEDVAGVVAWIEGLHAAANVALDLDERPMPRGPLFPRRRRRRNRQNTSGQDNGGNANAGQSNEN